MTTQNSAFQYDKTEFCFKSNILSITILYIVDAVIGNSNNSANFSSNDIVKIYRK